jgi:hypothetical protein
MPSSPIDVVSDESVTFANDRRRFLGTLARFTIAGLVIGMVGCTTEPESPAAAAPLAGGGCPQPGLAKIAADRAGTIASNHGHAATVTTAQQDAATAFNLSIQGSSGHDHTLALTAQDLADLKAGLQVVKTSSTGASHTHVVTFAAVVTSLAPRC